MTDALSFSDIQPELESRVRRIVWCTLATVDTKGRPRVRIVHPVWEGPIAYICTGRHSLKEKHLAKNPFVALSYWDPQHQQVYAECRCQWVDDLATHPKLRAASGPRSSLPVAAVPDHSSFARRRASAASLRIAASAGRHGKFLATSTGGSPKASTLEISRSQKSF